MTDSAVVFDPYEKVNINETFVPEIAYEFDNDKLSIDAIPHYILRSINRLARVGNVLRRQALICTQTCVDNYILDPPDCMDIVNVMSVCQICGCRCGKPLRLTHEPCCFPCGTATWFERPNTIFFRPTGCGTQYKVEMSVAPPMDACEVDKILYVAYYDVVVNGVKSMMYAMADRPWSSVNRATEYRELYENGIRAAAMDTLLGGQRGALRAKRFQVV